MQYLIISSEFPPGPGGIGMHAYCMTKGLLHNGVGVTVVCSMDYAVEDEIDDFLSTLPNGIQVNRIKRNGIITYINRVITILQSCRKKDYDKIILTGRFSLWMGWLLKIVLRKDIHTIAFVHGSELNMGSSMAKWFTRKSLQIADVCYAVSAYTKSLIEKSGIKREIRVLPNGLDINTWQDMDSVQPFAWQGSPKLLTVGSITQRKGQHNVIKSLPTLKQKYPDVHYHIVGKGDIKKLASVVDELGLQKNVTFHGKLNDADIKRTYKSVDVLCMLSELAANGDVEGFGIAVLEANIAGIPVIGSERTGLADAIQNGITGRLINPHNANALLNAMEDLLNSDKSTLAANCKAWVSQHDWRLLAKQLL